MKTWHFESLVVVLILSAITYFTGNRYQDWIAVLAVWLSFGHASISERLREKEAAQDIPTIECYQKLNYYWIAKEIVWVIFFLATKSYSALVGCFIFIIYPYWRKLWRKLHPKIQYDVI